MLPRLAPLDMDHVVESVPSWQELQGSRLFVTGGTGFFGMWLLESFLAARDRLRLDTSVVVLTRSTSAFETRAPEIARGVTLLEGDVRTFAFPPGAFDFVIHAATEASARLNDERPLEMFDSIVGGTRRMLDFATQARTSRLLMVSSGAVYGRQPPELSHVDEEFGGGPAPTDVRSAYGEGKRAAELLCAMYPIKTAVARCFAFVGPHLPLDRHFAVGNFIGDALAGRTINVRGDGTSVRSYLYAADLAVWLWTILFHGAVQRPYNVGSEEGRSVGEVARLVGAAVDPPASIAIAGTADPARAAERYVPSTRRARTELALKETIGLADAIARTIAWHRQAGGSR